MGYGWVGAETGPKTAAKALTILGFSKAQTSSLTTGQDSITGTTGPDVIRGVAGAAVGSQDATTLNSSDVIDGGAGLDTLVVNMTGNYGGGATVKNVETLTLGTNLAAASFDYNVNAGAYEVTGVTKIVADQITTGEALTVNNIVGTIPTLAWTNEASSLAGTVAYNFRSSAVEGSTTAATVELNNVRGGVLNLGTGVETITVNSNGTGNSVAMIDSGAGAATKVVLNAATGAALGQGYVVSTTAGTVGLEVATAPTAANTLHTSFVQVGANVVTVDASASKAAVNVQFPKAANDRSPPAAVVA